MTTMNTTSDDIDPRLQAISDALQEQKDDWVTIHNGEVVFDTLIAGAIAARATDILLGDDVAYCNPQCHEAEYEYFTAYIRSFSEDCTDEAYPCSDKILTAIKEDSTDGNPEAGIDTGTVGTNS